MLRVVPLILSNLEFPPANLDLNRFPDQLFRTSNIIDHIGDGEFPSRLPLVLCAEKNWNGLHLLHSELRTLWTLVFSSFTLVIAILFLNVNCLCSYMFLYNGWLMWMGLCLRWVFPLLFLRCQIPKTINQDAAIERSRVKSDYHIYVSLRSAVCAVLRPTRSLEAVARSCPLSVIMIWVRHASTCQRRHNIQEAAVIPIWGGTKPSLWRRAWATY